MKKKSINNKENIKTFTFPEYNLVIKAKSIEEATKKAKSLISKKK